ncbi:MAG: sigma-70 family RNA polymerase sigma factor [Chloroflexi bacterium]|nr:sigma-70 family RNA polymerase sigma factor [Chloroflexota bacterium]MCI0644340.1 sigma-70 family RNA polymerase sigma factor [Chloroflexota bacterium]MCI0725143.1 sigma-70 family RNA polymerase sigma factor [Chloroflexota bacterium]
MPSFNGEQVSADDLVDLYFHEMGREPLLSAEEEARLAQAIESGQAAAQRLAKEDAFETDRESWQRTWEAGEAARSRLIQANTRLVVSIAKRYRNRGLPFLDLIQEGNLGLMTAVDKFDYRLGHRFSTYATWWIRQAVSRALDSQRNTVRIPIHWMEHIGRLHQATQELAQREGREPTIEEIADHVTMPAEQVRALLLANCQPAHLDQPSKAGSDDNLGEFIEDLDAPEPAEVVAGSMLIEEIDQALEKLGPREAQILRLRYGLQDGEPHTLEEVGEMFGISRERIRQVEKEALKKLRRSKLAGYSTGVKYQVSGVR